ncbi:hypothetical protein F3Y22_tig00116962pilonHSYRG00765 [Hibiscus syriacus]|uniref:Uncharacterized protein n=1 Tax=Hibiscus syriacus TaxID=106335 RepID=A0A6A2WL21_HIBSY|nr:hypothetical protein F3Y22_tig00116962pilonHSYRG00765 [Hibiscus syriacus]
MARASPPRPPFFPVLRPLRSFRPRSRSQHATRSPLRRRVAKPLHVSPFMDMLGSWSLKANAPDQNLLVTISVQHPELGCPVDIMACKLNKKVLSIGSEAMVEKCVIHTTPKVGGSDLVTEVERYHGERYFVWRDAKWPWS